MRPKMRRDTVFIETPEGIYFRNDFNTFNVKGKTIYRTFAELLPYFDGSGAFQNYVTGLSLPRKDAALKLVDALFARRVLYETDLSDDVLEPPLESRFGPQLEFIEHLAPDPRRRFLQFRSRRIHLIGDGETAEQVGMGLVKSGLEKIYVSSHNPSVLEAIEGIAQSLREVDIPVTVVSVEPGEPSPGICDLIVLASDEASLNQIDRINREAIASRTRFLPSFVLGDKAVIGPLVEPDKPGCWFCAILRWTNNAQSPEAEALWRSLATGTDARSNRLDNEFPLAGLIATSLVLELFKYFALPEHSESVGSVLVQDLETLEASTHRIIQHPLCPRCRSSATRPSRSSAASSALIERDSVSADQVTIWTNMSSLGFGLIQGFEHDDLVQIPLRHSAVKISTRGYGGPEGLVHGYSIGSTEDAQFEALRNALRIYSTLLTSTVPRSRTTYDQLCEQKLNAVRSADIWGWLGNGNESASDPLNWVSAISVRSGETYYVPACAIDTHGGREPRWFETNMAGIGIGPSRESALRDGILSLITHRAQVDVLHGNISLYEASQEQVESMALNNETQFYLSTLQVLGLRPRVFPVDTAEGLTIVFTTLNSGNRVPIEHWKIAAGLSFAEAVNDAFRQLISDHQSGKPLYPAWACREDQSMYALSEIDLTPSLPYRKEPPSIDFPGLCRRSSNSGLLLQADITPADIRAVGNLEVCRVVYCQSLRS